MVLKVAVVMDPIENINPVKDTSFGLLLEAQERGFACSVIEHQNLFLRQSMPWACAQSVRLSDNAHHWLEITQECIVPLTAFDVVLMRKDPPFDMHYIYLTYLLEYAQKQGVKVYNDSAGIRNANEKLLGCEFPQCVPHTLVTMQADLIHAFVKQHQQCVIKPLGGMGGQGVFRLNADDDNCQVIIQTVTDNASQLVMVQPYLSAISQGDKRIILIKGQPIPYGLSRIPASGDFHGNLAAGAQGVVKELTARDYWLCEQVASTLVDRGLWFVGLDVIGDYMTEINVTSPTCAREITRATSINVCGQFWNVLIESCYS